MIKNLARLGSFALVASLATNIYAQTLTPGDLVVYRVGDGSGALGAASTIVFADEYTTSGTLVESIMMPTNTVGSQLALTAAGNATSEGLLTLSANGEYIMLSGYNTSTGTASVATSSSTTISRGVGIIDLDGNVNTTTSLTNVDTGGNIRGVASSDGTNIWITGSISGVQYTTRGTVGAATSLGGTPTNTRGVNIFGGQLMVSDQSGSAIRIGAVGTGLPTTSGQTITALPGVAGNAGGMYAFVQLTLNGGPSPDTMYVADDLDSVILKYSLVGGVWVTNGSVSAVAPRGLTAEVVGGNVELFGTDGNSTTITNMFEITDSSGYDGLISSNITTIATAAANEQFRGIVVIPAAVPEPSTVILVGVGVLGMLSIRRRRS
jgi:PEP-CTERM motif-containing protein